MPPQRPEFWHPHGKLVDAIGRSDHSVLYQLQPSSAPPINESPRAAEGQQTLEVEPMQL
jgi:hypothetical protein